MRVQTYGVGFGPCNAKYAKYVNNQERDGRAVNDDMKKNRSSTILNELHLPLC